MNYRATVNDNMLVTVMIETLEGVANAEEIAATHGVDVVIFGNNDLELLGMVAGTDPRYQDALVKVHDAALNMAITSGNAGAQYSNGYVLSADTRMVQNGARARRPGCRRRAAVVPAAARHRRDAEEATPLSRTPSRSSDYRDAAAAVSERPDQTS